MEWKGDGVGEQMGQLGINAIKYGQVQKRLESLSGLKSKVGLK
jgi:hypothetical protein